ncbi:MAG: AAA family ATPase [Candidatus Methanoperedens sp.]|nr:AAA family ATPase [Candidatus Methanoperedens sp.]
MVVEKQIGTSIKSAEITNFRGIKECKVDDLSLVNIFVGINNSRKSTLLDAIYIGCKEHRNLDCAQLVDSQLSLYI